jgi:hypothetical protein
MNRDGGAPRDDVQQSHDEYFVGHAMELVLDLERLRRARLLATCAPACRKRSLAAKAVDRRSIATDEYFLSKIPPPGLLPNTFGVQSMRRASSQKWKEYVRVAFVNNCDSQR